MDLKTQIRWTLPYDIAQYMADVLFDIILFHQQHTVKNTITAFGFVYACFVSETLCRILGKRQRKTCGLSTLPIAYKAYHEDIAWLVVFKSG